MCSVSPESPYEPTRFAETNALHCAHLYVNEDDLQAERRMYELLRDMTATELRQLARSADTLRGAAANVQREASRPWRS